MTDALAELQAQFDPTQPLPARDPRYVAWAPRLGLNDTTAEARRIVSRAVAPEVVLLTGQRGTGKSSDLNRLAAELREVPGGRWFVTQMSAASDDGDVSAMNGALLTFRIARALVADLRGGGLDYRGKFDRYVERVRSRLAGVEVDWELPLGLGLSLAFRDAPAERERIRRALEAEVPTLLDVVNAEVLPAARRALAEKGRAGIVVLVDDLDHVDDAGDDVARRFFLRDAPTLRALGCTVVYTVPIGLAFGPHYQELRNLYGHILEVGYVPVRTRDGAVDENAVSVITEIVEHRLDCAGVGGDALGDAGWPRRLALLSGGSLRSLLRVVTTALSLTDTLPLAGVLGTSIRRDADNMARFLDNSSLALLAAVAQSHERPGGDEAELERWADLVNAGCVLAYRDRDQSTWYDRHPLLGDYEQALA